MQCKKSLENVKCKPVGDGSIFTHNKDPNSRIVYATMLFNIEEKESYIAAVSLSGTGQVEFHLLGEKSENCSSSLKANISISLDRQNQILIAVNRIGKINVMLINSKSSEKSKEAVELYIAPKFDFTILLDEPNFLIDNFIAKTKNASFKPTMVKSSRKQQFELDVLSVSESGTVVYSFNFEQKIRLSLKTESKGQMSSKTPGNIQFCSSGSLIVAMNKDQNNSIISIFSKELRELVLYLKPADIGMKSTFSQLYCPHSDSKYAVITGLNSTAQLSYAVLNISKITDSRQRIISLGTLNEENIVDPKITAVGSDKNTLFLTFVDTEKKQYLRQVLLDGPLVMINPASPTNIINITGSSNGVVIGTKPLTVQVDNFDFEVEVKAVKDTNSRAGEYNLEELATISSHVKSLEFESKNGLTLQKRLNKVETISASEGARAPQRLYMVKDKVFGIRNQVTNGHVESLVSIFDKNQTSIIFEKNLGVEINFLKNKETIGITATKFQSRDIVIVVYYNKKLGTVDYQIADFNAQNPRFKSGLIDKKIRKISNLGIILSGSLGSLFYAYTIEQETNRATIYRLELQSSTTLKVIPLKAVQDVKSAALITMKSIDVKPFDYFLYTNFENDLTIKWLQLSANEKNIKKGTLPPIGNYPIKDFSCKETQCFVHSNDNVFFDFKLSHDLDGKIGFDGYTSYKKYPGDMTILDSTEQYVATHRIEEGDNQSFIDVYRRDTEVEENNLVFYSLDTKMENLQFGGAAYFKVLEDYNNVTQTYLNSVADDQQSMYRGFNFEKYRVQNFTLEIESSIDPNTLVDYPIVFNGDKSPEMTMAYFFFINPPKKGDQPDNHHRNDKNMWIYMLLAVVFVVVLIVGITVGVVIYRRKAEEEEEKEVQSARDYIADRSSSLQTKTLGLGDGSVTLKTEEESGKGTQRKSWFRRKKKAGDEKGGSFY